MSPELKTTRAGAVWVVFGLALVLRLAAVLVLRSYVDPPLYEHGEIAENLRAGKGFAIAVVNGPHRTTSQQTPLYPGLMVGLRWVFGRYGDIPALQLLQAALGACTAVFIMNLASVLFGRRLGLWAGLLVACYPTYAYMVTHVQVVTLLLFFMSGAMWLLAEGIFAEGGTRRWVVGSALLGLAVLTDPIAIVVLPVLLLSYGWTHVRQAAVGDGPWRRVAERVGITLSVILIVLLPWTIRNAMVHHRLMLVKSTFWYSFWQGNNPNSWGTDKILTGDSGGGGEGLPLWDVREAARKLVEWREAVVPVDTAIPHDVLERMETMTEVEKCEVFRGMALDFLRNDFGRYLRLCGRRLMYFFWVDPTNPKTRHWVYRAGNLLLAVFALLGVILAWRGARRQVLFALACAAVILGFHTLTIYAARFRLPVEIFMLCLAGFAVAFLASRLHRRAVSISPPQSCSSS